jgi:hypothetical protein
VNILKLLKMHFYQSKKKLFFLVLMITSFSAMSQNEHQKEVEVRAMEVKEAQALLQKDISTLKEIWSPEFMVNSPMNTVNIGGQVELVAAGIIAYTSFVREIEHVKVLKDVVITMGSETVVPAGGPMAGKTVNRRYTNIWIKEKGKWILTARHANNICPAPPPISTSSKDQVPVMEITGLVRNNPSTNSFQIDLSKLVNEKVFITVSDINGRLVEKFNLPMKNQMISLGDNYGKGIYIAEINNGFNRSTVKLIKL